MELIYKEMPENYTLVDTGDWHIGPKNCHEDGILELITRVWQDKNCYVQIKGDLIDAVVANDKRFAHCSMGEYKTPQEQADRLIELLQPIKDKIVALGLGNHEYKLINTFDIARYVCDNLGCRWSGVAHKFIALDNGKPMHKIFGCHGNGSIRSVAKDPIQADANKKALLKKKLQHLFSDCIYMSMGHTHQLFKVDPTVENELNLTDKNGKVVQNYRTESDQTADYIPPESRYYGNSGSMLKTYSEEGSIGYAEMAMYAPSEMGWLEIHVRDRKVVCVEKVVV